MIYDIITELIIPDVFVADKNTLSWNGDKELTRARVFFLQDLIFVWNLDLVVRVSFVYVPSVN